MGSLAWMIGFKSRFGLITLHVGDIKMNEYCVCFCSYPIIKKNKKHLQEKFPK